MRVRTCLRCGHTGEALDAGGLCNQLVMRDGHGDTCGCSCTWDKVTTVEDERDGTLGEVIDLRVQVYGDPTETFIRIAQVWSGILGHEVNAIDVPLCLIGMKAVRTTQAPDYSDNSDDIEGYLDIFRQLVGEDMVHARSVTEYIAIKEGREDNPKPVKTERVLVDRDECRHWNKHIQVSDHTEAECPVAGIAADNARQSVFYTENDRTKDAGPDKYCDPDAGTHEPACPQYEDEEYQPRSINEMRRDCTCESYGIGKPRWHKDCPVHGDIPIPYQLSEDERAQQLRRAATVRDLCTCWGNEGPVACPVHVTKDPS